MLLSIFEKIKDRVVQLKENVLVETLAPTSTNVACTSTKIPAVLAYANASIPDIVITETSPNISFNGPLSLEDSISEIGSNVSVSSIVSVPSSDLTIDSYDRVVNRKLNDNSDNLTIDSYDRAVVRDKVDSNLTDCFIMTR